MDENLTSIALSLTGAALGLFSALYSVRRVFSKKKAEEKLLMSLQEELLSNTYSSRIKGSSYIDQLKILRDCLEQGDKIDPELWNAYKEILSRAIEKLSEREAGEVREAVEQPSLIGQRKYMHKLVGRVLETSNAVTSESVEEI